MLNFKEEVLKYRYAFNQWELDRNLTGPKCTNSNQPERRRNFRKFLLKNGAHPEIIDFSMNEFLRLRRN